MPALYVVATPIGNLEDITLRALRVLREVKLIAAEDTRKTRRLLNAYGIKTPSTSYYEHNKVSKLEYLMGFLQTGDVALVSEAGTPGMSDPGYELIVAAQARGVPVIPVPGPTVMVAALSVSGMPADRVLFVGFLPRTASGRRQALWRLAEEPGTIVVLEAPHRIPASLKDILEILGDRRIAVCRELTKVHEEVFRGTVSQAVAHFELPRGEFTLVIEGRPERAKPAITGEIEARLRLLAAAGIPAKPALAEVAADTGVSRKELYRAWLRLQKVPADIKTDL